MHNIQLILENHEIELNDSVVFSLTKTFEDLANPTVINNDWSKTVEIPFTNRNNQIFGHIYSPDKVIVDGTPGADKIGVYFNPYLKLNMMLLYDNMILIYGYAKMNSIKQKDGRGTYNITLNGELGKVFQELKKITFDATAYQEGSGSTYYIDGSKYVDEYINQSIVSQSWASFGQYAAKLYPKTNANWRLTDIIGFAPNNAFSEDFDYSSYQTDLNNSQEFTEALGDSFKEETGIEPSSLLPNGLLPREFGEYRSYHQLPFVYWNKLFQMFQEKAEEVTGYDFELDTDWFTSLNPYWYNLVYMLKPFDTKSGDIKNNMYSGVSTSFYSTSYVNIGDWYTNSDYTHAYTNRMNPLATVYEQESGVIESDRYHNQFNFGDNQLLNIHIRLNTYLLVVTQHESMKSDNGLLITVTATGSNNNTTDVTFLIRQAGSTVTYDDAIIVETNASSTSTYTIVLPQLDAYFNLSKVLYGDYVTLSTTTRWVYNRYPITGNATGEVALFYGNSIQGSTVVGYPTLVEVIVPAGNWFHSNAPFIFNDLWNNDYNLFNEILNYCKMYRLIIDVDYNNKKIKIMPAATYFDNYVIEDWTDKVDYSRDYTIKPITFENKYVLFNYDDDDTKMGEEYLAKYGLKYGEKRLITEYNFNEETKELFEGITKSSTKTDNVLSWANIRQNKIVYSFPAELYVYSKNSDNRYVDNFGAYYFYLGRANFDTQSSLKMMDVYISDDTAFQQVNNKYMYTHLDDYMAHVTTYPLLDIVSGTNVCTFNTPSECWTYANNYDNTNGIYYNFWQKYINERYNVQNKILTCYINISPIDYCNFRFNKFVKIENQLYMVNKIYDYDMTSLAPTKVDLVTIQNIAGYTTNNYNN